MRAALWVYHDLLINILRRREQKTSDFHCTEMTHSIGTVLYKCKVEYIYFSAGFRQDNESSDIASLTRHLSAIYCQTKPMVSVISFIILSASEVAALLKYILIFVQCGLLSK